MSLKIATFISTQLNNGIGLSFFFFINGFSNVAQTVYFLEYHRRLLLHDKVVVKEERTFLNKDSGYKKSLPWASRHSFYSRYGTVNIKFNVDVNG